MSYRYESRRFPYRTEDGDDPEIVKREISTILTGVESMIYQAVRNKARRYNVANNDHDIDDMVMETMQHLWLYALPEYDRERKPYSKVETFLFNSIHNYVTDRVRQRRTKRFKLMADLPIDPHTLDAIPREYHDDRRIEAIAIAILRNPEKLLSEKQAIVLQFLADNLNMSRTEMAASIGYTRTNPLRNIEDRIVMILLQVDPADYEQPKRTVRHAERVACISDPNPHRAA